MRKSQRKQKCFICANCSAFVAQGRTLCPAHAHCSTPPAAHIISKIFRESIVTFRSGHHNRWPGCAKWSETSNFSISGLTLPSKRRFNKIPDAFSNQLFSPHFIRRRRGAAPRRSMPLRNPIAPYRSGCLVRGYGGLKSAPACAKHIPVFTSQRWWPEDLHPGIWKNKWYLCWDDYVKIWQKNCQNFEMC